MAADPSLSQTAQGLVTSGGKSPERAVWEAGDQVAAMLEGLGGYMAERATDVRDVRARIVAELRGEQANRKSTRLNSSHVAISYAVFCLKKKTHTCSVQC